VQIKDIDLNLLRLFDAVYRSGSVSRAADQLDLTQPTASQGVARLRRMLHDPLFTRVAGGVEPTPKANRLAGPVREALATLEQALADTTQFDPAASRRVFQIHMSDIGEARFLPGVMTALRARAPGVRIETRPVVPREQIGALLDSGRLDFAIGHLPSVKDTQRTRLLKDQYSVLLRHDHPFLNKAMKGRALISALKTLEFVAVRSHADTLRILKQLGLEDRLRLVTEHFLVLPSIVAATDLVAIAPGGVVPLVADRLAAIRPDLPQSQIAVALHWSRRFESDPGSNWLRHVILELFENGA